jgi:hypothetical protein
MGWWQSLGVVSISVALVVGISLPLAISLADSLSISVQIDNSNNNGGNNNNGGGNNNGGSGGSGGSGGGGGGSGPGPAAPVTMVVFAGIAYRENLVTLLKDAQLAATIVAGPDARFQISLNGLSAGSYIFSLYGEDSQGRRSNLFTFPITVTAGVVTTISGIFIAPTIDVDKAEVKRGDNITILGQSAPDAVVTIAVNSDEETFVTAQANSQGAYVKQFDTAPLEIGDHITKAKAASGEQISPFGLAVGFNVGTKNVGKENICAIKADLNGDCRVNLVDFSILAYWYQRANPPRPLDLNDDGIINIVDFSIMAYYWTG